MENEVKADVSYFLSKFKSGFARANRYLIEFSLPPGIAESAGYVNKESSAGTIQRFERLLNGNQQIQVACHTCSMPGRSISTYSHTQHCAPFRVPYSQQYDPISFSFYNSAEMEQRHFFDIWQTAVININDNSLNFFVEYTQDIDIWQLNRNNDKMYGVRLYAAWPISIAETSYNANMNNQVTTTTVTLEYKLWKNNFDTTEILIYG